MKGSIVINQWGKNCGNQLDSSKFHIFPLRMLNRNIKVLFDGWKSTGEMNRFHLEIIYAQV